MQVLGYHLLSVPTQLSSYMSFNGLELELERKLERAVWQTKMIIKALLDIHYKLPAIGT